MWGEVYPKIVSQTVFFVPCFHDWGQYGKIWADTQRILHDNISSLDPTTPKSQNLANGSNSIPVFSFFSFSSFLA